MEKQQNQSTTTTTSTTTTNQQPPPPTKEIKKSLSAQSSPSFIKSSTKKTPIMRNVIKKLKGKRICFENSSMLASGGGGSAVASMSGKNSTPKRFQIMDDGSSDSDVDYNDDTDDAFPPNQNWSSDNELQHVGEMLISIYKCTVCKKVPRPRLNQLSFVVCPEVEHVVCVTCLSSQQQPEFCVACDENIQSWLFPTSEYGMIKTLYESASSLVTFFCHRQCGLGFQGYDPIIEHDRTCQYGREMLCPIDNLPVKMFDHGNHTAHLDEAFPLEVANRNWSLVFDWQHVADHREKKVPIPAVVLYMDNERNFLDKEDNGQLDPYTPRAACVSYKVASVSHKYNEETKKVEEVTSCSMSIRWMETESKDVATDKYLFKVEHIKPKMNRLTVKHGCIIPTFQQHAPPPTTVLQPQPSRKRKSSEALAPALASPPVQAEFVSDDDEEEDDASSDEGEQPFKRRRGNANNSSSRVINTTSFVRNKKTWVFDNVRMNSLEISKKIPCHLCGLFNCAHSHFKITLVARPTGCVSK